MLLKIGINSTRSSPSKTPFYTHAESSRMYLFTPDLGAETGAGVYVKIMLPQQSELPDTEESTSRVRFEEILVKHGYLKPRSAGEEGAQIES